MAFALARCDSLNKSRVASRSPGAHHTNDQRPAGLPLNMLIQINIVMKRQVRIPTVNWMAGSLRSLNPAAKLMAIPAPQIRICRQFELRQMAALPG